MASVVSGGRSVNEAFHLVDSHTFIQITLDKDFGIGSIKTLAEAEAKKCDKIHELEPLKVAFANGSPPMLPRYQLKLKNGRVVDGELRPDRFYGSTPSWYFERTDKQIPQSDIAGWRRV